MNGYVVMKDDKKTYKVKLKPYRYDYYEAQEFIVAAKDNEEAYSIAKSQMYDMFKDQPIDGWHLMGAKVI
jgi:hypothetical protein